jgi:2-polyprenyl-3-methyl-5-hydroxy-6-metoxy-1,4-benzoquinol methylase
VTIQEQFGGIDIYLFDQLQRGRIAPGDRILDVGCGFGRNLAYLLRAGYDVAGLDADTDAIREVQGLAARLAPSLPPSNFRVERIEASTFPSGAFTVVIASAVLHFARDAAAFDAMLRGAWRLLAPGGMLFCRLASTIGMESRLRATGDDPRRYRLPDGTDRYLVDEAMLVAYVADLGGQLLDPIKTTVVQDQRAMTTWVVRKSA